MKPIKNKITLSPQNSSESAPTIEMYDSILECSFTCEGEYHYAIATESGSIVLKGEFLNGFRLDISNIDCGYYQLVLFNAFKRHIYSFNVQ